MPNGKIHQLVPLRRTAFHAGTGYLAGHRGSINRGLIGIELSNPSVPGRSVRYPEAQLAALDFVIKNIDRTMGRRLPIYGHRDVIRSGGWRKGDPHGNFPLAQYKRRRSHAPAHSVLRIGPYTKERNLNGFWMRMTKSQKRAKVRRFTEGQRRVVRLKGRKYALEIGPLASKRAVREARRAALVVSKGKVKVLDAPQRPIVAAAKRRPGPAKKAQHAGRPRPQPRPQKIVMGFIPPAHKPLVEAKVHKKSPLPSLALSKAVAEEPSPKPKKPAVKKPAPKRPKPKTRVSRRPRRRFHRTYLQVGPYNKSNLSGFWKRMAQRQERAKVRPFKDSQRHVLRLNKRGDAYRIGPLHPKRAAREARRARLILPDSKVRLVQLAH